MAASDDRLVVVQSRASCASLDASTGSGGWSDPAGPLTAPPLVHGECLLVASGEQVICYRVADGSRVWSARDRHGRAAAGRRRRRASTSRRRTAGVIALELTSGEPAWEFRSASSRPSRWSTAAACSLALRPSASAASSRDTARSTGAFGSVPQSSGGRWPMPTHVYLRRARQPAARARPEERRVSLEERSAAIGRRPDRCWWARALRRQATCRASRCSIRAQGTPTIQLTLATSLATLPLLIERDRGHAGADCGGDRRLAERCGPSRSPARLPPTHRRSPSAPLTALPGQAIPIGWPPAPPGRLPPAAVTPSSIAIRRRRRERQPDELTAAAVHEKRLARDVDDAVFDRARDHRVGVDGRRQRGPQKESAARIGPGDASPPNSRAQRSHHHVALVLIVSAAGSAPDDRGCRAGTPRRRSAGRARRCRGPRPVWRSRAWPRSAAARRSTRRDTPARASSRSCSSTPRVPIDRRRASAGRRPRLPSPRSTDRDRDRLRRSGRRGARPIRAAPRACCRPISSPVGF